MCIRDRAAVETARQVAHVKCSGTCEKAKEEYVYTGVEDCEMLPFVPNGGDVYKRQMLVVGGRHSSNTQKLFEICKKECENTYYIQTPVDLDSDMFQCSSYVGITAGASTPKKIIEEVQEHVRIKF